MIDERSRPKVEFIQVHFYSGAFSVKQKEVGRASVDPAAVAIVAETTDREGITTLGFHSGDKMYVVGDYDTVTKMLSEAFS